MGECVRFLWGGGEAAIIGEIPGDDPRDNPHNPTQVPTMTWLRMIMHPQQPPPHTESMMGRVL